MLKANLSRDASPAPAHVPEQRLVLRILSLWRAAHRGEFPPQADALTVAATGDDAGNVFTISLAPPAEPRFAYIGDALRPRVWREVNSGGVGECPPDSILGLASKEWREIVERRVPVTRGGIGWHDTAPVLYRAIMVPLFDAAGTIAMVMGAANWRTVEVQGGPVVD